MEISIRMPEYTEKELEEIYAAQDREEIRGANPRFWEDVKVGDELTPVVRGPITDNEARAWHSGGHCHQLSDRLNRILWAKEPLEKEFLVTYRSDWHIPGKLLPVNNRKHGVSYSSPTGWGTMDLYGSLTTRFVNSPCFKIRPGLKAK